MTATNNNIHKKGTRTMAKPKKRDFTFGEEAKKKAPSVEALKVQIPKPAESVADKGYNFMVKGKAGSPSTVLKVNGREMTMEVGSKVRLELEDLKLPEAITSIFNPLMKAPFPTDSMHVAIKAGYGLPQLGFTRPGVSWRGFFTFTDGQLCTHHWPDKGIDMDKIRKLGRDAGLNQYRSGPGWQTWHFGGKEKEAVSFGKELLKLIK